ncbi:MAG: hypothetical protein IPN71_02200 [Fibrobacteres bacterium]|nr:hypothetical protein [Fibrobacterota bacterium]
MIAVFLEPDCKIILVFQQVMAHLQRSPKLHEVGLIIRFQVKPEIDHRMVHLASKEGRLSHLLRTNRPQSEPLEVGDLFIRVAENRGPHTPEFEPTKGLSRQQQHEQIRPSHAMGLVGFASVQGEQRRCIKCLSFEVDGRELS